MIFGEISSKPEIVRERQKEKREKRKEERNRELGKECQKHAEAEKRNLKYKKKRRIKY
jgi:hypothetical protein